MELLTDPSVWIGLFTLIILEIVLGIDNLVFIAILADKLPPSQRDRARLLGLSLALVMRLVLLFAISWLVKLTRPIVWLAGFGFSGRDLILLFGGLFLVFKATMELHDRLEGTPLHGKPRPAYAGFWMVVLQIIVLDMVFSLDAVITAVGMIEHLSVMMAAVIVAMGVMIAASKPLTRFVSGHPTVILLCLSFLLMIGFSLIADGFGYSIPKGYLYAAIGFSILIETFNQVSWRNLAKREARLPLRERTANTILRLMGGRQSVADAQESVAPDSPATAFGEEERFMISGVLTLGQRSVRMIMTPRSDISWIDGDSDAQTIRTQLLETPHSLFPVCRGVLDEIVGVVQAKALLAALDSGENLNSFAARHPPIVVLDTTDVIKLLGVLRKARGSLVLVVDEYGSIEGLVTPLDILEAIAGEFPDADETPEIVRDGDGWLVKGTADLHLLEQSVGSLSLASDEDYVTVSGLLLAQHGSVPDVGEILQRGDVRFEIMSVSELRVELVRISRESVEPELV